MAVALAVVMVTLPPASRAAASTGSQRDPASASGRIATGAADDAGGDGPVDVPLRERNDSNVAGTATLFPAGDRTVLVLAVSGRRARLAAHLHRGRCQALDPAPAFPLTDARAGAATSTTVDVPLGELLAGGYAIVVRQPADHLDALLDPAGIVACGELRGPDEVTALPATGSGPAHRRPGQGRDPRPGIGFVLAVLALSRAWRAGCRDGDRPTGW